MTDLKVFTDTLRFAPLLSSLPLFQCQFPNSLLLIIPLFIKSYGLTKQSSFCFINSLSVVRAYCCKNGCMGSGKYLLNLVSYLRVGAGEKPVQEERHAQNYLLVYSLGFGKLAVTELKVAFKSCMLPPLMDFFMKLLYSALIHLLFQFLQLLRRICSTIYLLII